MGDGLVHPPRDFFKAGYVLVMERNTFKVAIVLHRQLQWSSQYLRRCVPET